VTPDSQSSAANSPGEGIPNPGVRTDPASAGAADARSLEALLDVSLPVVIEIGRTSLTLSEIVQLKAGSVVQLDRLVGDSVDIHVSDRKLAEGEVVVIGDHFGVRVTRVLSQPAMGEAA
jgi:flagellar motor switch protein FliN/FliY